MIKECVICGGFFSTQTRKITCSEACSSSYRKTLNREWNEANPDKVKLIEKRVREKRKISGKEGAARQARRNTKAGFIDRCLERARRITPDTDLDRDYLENLLNEDRCNVTSTPFKYNKEGKTSWENPYSPSLDRIDSDMGYYKGNVQAVLTTVNLAKNKMSMVSFKNVWKDILNNWSALVD